MAKNDIIVSPCAFKRLVWLNTWCLYLYSRKKHFVMQLLWSKKKKKNNRHTDSAADYCSSLYHPSYSL